MDHKAELDKLPSWCAFILEKLLERAPSLVANEMGIVKGRIDWARTVGWRTLGDSSPLMLACSGHRSGPLNGSRHKLKRESDWVQLFTTPGPDGHVHIARFNGAGNGLTDLVGGHHHRVHELDVVATDHRHELTDRRA